MDFGATPPPPPPPPLSSARSEKYHQEEDGGWSAEDMFIFTKEILGWCTNKYKKGRGQMGVPLSIMGGGVVVLGFAAPGIVLALPIKSRALLVNFWGFALPTLATIDEMDTTEDRRSKPPSSFIGYWVFFGFFGILDGFLPAITPCYFFTKACVLTWAASSARPYGGRPVINRTLETIDNTNHTECKPLRTMAKALGPSEDMAARAGLPRRAFRLTTVAVAVAAGVFALGVASSLVLAVEGFFASLPSWTQEKACVIAGASWPLYETLLARARSEAAAEGSEDSMMDKKRRLGPAAVQWLSYWPIYALFLAALDPILGWVPHFYSFKLVTLVFLALPQTRGAYLITSLLLYGDDEDTDSSGASPDAKGRGVESPLREGGEEQKTNPGVLSGVSIE